MIDPLDFMARLNDENISFFCGVPDSLLSPLSQSLEQAEGKMTHHICANEGNAVALAAGHHLGSGDMACVYMQNSGFGNALNPLVSLADPDVYAIPMLLVVGWRGEMTPHGQMADEPQHKKQGAISATLLETLDIPFAILGPDTAHWAEEVRILIDRAKTEHRPVALLVRKNTFAMPDPVKDVGAPTQMQSDMTREHAIEIIIHTISPTTPVVATTGKASRELYELRQRAGQSHEADFLTVGSMGHAAQIAAGIAVSQPDQTVLCLDGDGACWMHLGSLKATARVNNLKHIVLHNGIHDSVGGQRTVGGTDSLAGIAKECGSEWCAQVSSAHALQAVLGEFMNTKTSAFLEVCVLPGARAELGRPKTAPIENKADFMRFIGARKTKT